MLKFLQNLFKKSVNSVQPDIVQQTYKIFLETKSYPFIPEEARNAFLMRCKELTEDYVLDRIIDEIVGEFAESIIQKADTINTLQELRYKMFGADEVRKRLIRYAQEIEKKETFNPHETI